MGRCTMNEPKCTIGVERMHMRVLLDLSTVVGPIDTTEVVSILKGLERIGFEFVCPSRYAWRGDLDSVTHQPRR